MDAANPPPRAGETSADAERFSRQTRFAPIGPAGLERLHAAQVAIVGVGALGGAAAMLLLRAGVRRLRLIDRDIVEASNLPRQILFSEQDARLALPKVVAAREHLLAIDARAEIAIHPDDLVAGNVGRLLEGADLIVDGLDNLATRYLLNDHAIASDTPWVYGGAIAGHALVFPIRPGASACLRCLFPEPPDAARMETCDTAGVLSPLPALVAAVQACEAIKLIVGAHERLLDRALAIDAWDGTYRPAVLLDRRPDCPCCARRELPFLAAGDTAAAALCGRDVVQVRPERRTLEDLAALGARLEAVVPTRVHPQFLRFAADGVEFTVFAGGRALIRGTSDLRRARSLYARWVGC